MITQQIYADTQNQVSQMLLQIIGSGGQLSVPRAYYYNYISQANFQNPEFGNLLTVCTEAWLAALTNSQVMNSPQALFTFVGNILEAMAASFALAQGCPMDMNTGMACQRLAQTLQQIIQGINNWKNQMQMGGVQQQQSYYPQQQQPMNQSWQQAGQVGNRNAQMYPAASNIPTGRPTGPVSVFGSGSGANYGARSNSSAMTTTREAQFDNDIYPAYKPKDEPAQPAQQPAVAGVPNWQNVFATPVKSQVAAPVVAQQVVQAVPDQNDTSQEAIDERLKQAVYVRVSTMRAPSPLAHNPYAEDVDAILDSSVEEKVTYVYREVRTMDQSRHQIKRSFGNNVVMPFGAVAARLEEVEQKVAEAIESKAAADDIKFSKRVSEHRQIESGIENIWADGRMDFTIAQKDNPKLDIYQWEVSVTEPLFFTNDIEERMVRRLDDARGLKDFTFMYQEYTNSAAISQLVRRAIDRRLTDAINRAFRTYLSLYPLHIDSFAEDFAGVPAYLAEKYGQVISDAFEKNFIMIVKQALTSLDDDNAKTLLTEGYGVQDPSSVKVMFCSSNVVGSILNFNAADLAIVFDVRASALITEDKTPLMHKIAIDALKASDASTRYLFETADGFRFELSRGWVNTDYLLISTIA